jgi:hypothetical protein
VDRAIVAVLHVNQGASTLAHHFDYDTRRVFGYFDLDLFVRLDALAIYYLQDDFGLGHLELEPLAAHILYQDREVKLTPAADNHGIGILGIADAEGDVAL